MLDLHFIRENTAAVQKNCIQRNLNIDVAHLVDLDQRRRTQMAELQTVQHECNQLAKSMQGKPSDEQRERGKQLKQRETELDQQLSGS